LKALESEEESTFEDADEDYNILLRRTRSSRAEAVVTKALEKKNIKVSSTVRRLDTSLLNVQTCRRKNPKKNLRSQSSNPTNSRSKSRRV